MSELIYALWLGFGIAIVWILIDKFGGPKGNTKPGLAPPDPWDVNPFPVGGPFDDIDRMVNDPWPVYYDDYPLRVFRENKFMTECDRRDMPPDLQAKANAVSMRVEASLLGVHWRGISDNFTLVTCSYCGQGIRDGVCPGCGSRQGPVKCSHCGSGGRPGEFCKGCGSKLPVQ